MSYRSPPAAPRLRLPQALATLALRFAMRGRHRQELFQGPGQAAPSSVLGACSSSHRESELEAGRAPGAQRGDRTRPRTP